MKPVEVATYEERTVWRARQDELRKHKSWTNRKSYHPNNMDDWEALGKEIIYKYNIQLQEMNKTRKESEKQYEIQLMKERELRKEQLKRQNEEKARLNEERRNGRIKTRQENISEPRRSKRIKLSNCIKMEAAHGLLALRNAQL